MRSQVTSEVINRKVLRISVVFTVVFTLIALTVGFIISSQVILFDGIFNLVGIALTYLSISAMNFIKKKDEWNYPFGKATFEPFIAIVQYAIILYICLSTVTTAIGVMINGGHEVHMVSGVIYGLFSTLYNLAVFTYLRLLTKKHQSSIAKVEVDQWKFTFLLGVGILIGFSMSYGLSLTTFYQWAAFSDPVLTIVITLLFAKTAIFSIKSCMKEMLQGIPSKEMVDLITEKITAINQHYEFSQDVLRLAKVGHKIIIELDYVIECGSPLDSIMRQDQLRKALTDAFSELPYEKWININFTSEIKFVDHLKPE
ncbi:MAG: cation transporter [Defluviitaleaceae bacterium]|nr:cation transporter [Defluviitaleaceae bacterium]